MEQTNMWYKVQPSNIYNFDENVFMMGVLTDFYIIIQMDIQGSRRHF